MNTFTYLGHTIKPLRNLTAVESGLQNIERRTNGYLNPVVIEGYNYNDFYAAARENNAVVDLFIIDGKEIVIPNNGGLQRYNEGLPLQKCNLTYFSQCCGKIVECHKASNAGGYRVTGKVEQTGNTYCPRCMRDVTKTGKVKKTPRNHDIDKNGSWDYKLT